MSFLFDTDLDALNALNNRQGDPGGIDAAIERLKAGIRINTITEAPDGSMEALHIQIDRMNQSIAATQTMIDQFRDVEAELGRISYLIDNIRCIVRDAAEDIDWDLATARRDQAEIRTALRAIDCIADGLRANRKVWWAGSNTGAEAEPLTRSHDDSSAENSVSLSLPDLNSHSLGLTALPGHMLVNIDVTTESGASRALRILSAASVTVDTCWEQLRRFRREVLQPACDTMNIRIANATAGNTTIQAANAACEAVEATIAPRLLERASSGFYTASKLPAPFHQLL